MYLEPALYAWHVKEKQLVHHWFIRIASSILWDTIAAYKSIFEFSQRTLNIYISSNLCLYFRSPVLVTYILTFHYHKVYFLN